MNTWAVAILTALLAEYGLEGATNALNVRAHDPEVPEAFRDVHDAERYRRAQGYARARTRFGMLGTTIIWRPPRLLARRGGAGFA